MPGMTFTMMISGTSFTVRRVVASVGPCRIVLCGSVVPGAVSVSWGCMIRGLVVRRSWSGGRCRRWIGGRRCVCSVDGWCGWSMSKWWIFRWFAWCRS